MAHRRKDKKKKRNKIVVFLKELIATYKKIDWPDKKTLFKNLVAVVLISAIITGYLIGIDTVFFYIRNLILFR